MLKAIAAWFREAWIKATWRPVRNGRGRIDMSDQDRARIFEDLRIGEEQRRFNPGLRNEALAQLRSRLSELRADRPDLHEAEDRYVKKISSKIVNGVRRTFGTKKHKQVISDARD